MLAQNLGVPTEDILNTVVTQIHAGDQVNFTLSIVEMIPVQELLPAGWRVSRHCRHLGCILPRVSATIVRTGARGGGSAV